MKTGIKPKKASGAWLVALSPSLVTLFITPNYSSEPIDLPKMFLLTICSSLIFGYILINFRMFFNRQNRFFITVILAFILQMLAVIIFSGSPFNQQFFGTYGRNTGFLTYLSLCILMSGAALNSGEFLNRKLILFLSLTGIASIIYGLFQVENLDPIKWNNPYNSMIGFLGNPDFSSAFLGIVVCSSTSVLVLGYKEIKIMWRLLHALVILLGTYLVIKSHALQGMVVIALGFSLTLIIFLTKKLKLTWKISLLPISMVSVTLFIGLLGSLKIGPLADLLYKTSVRQRGFYWQAARQMMTHHPIFGVGLDSYGDFYYQFRSRNAAFHSSGISSNSAHSIFLDLGSSGGLILYLVFTILIGYLFVKSIQYMRKHENIHYTFYAIFTAWLGYQAQSLVSINQIGLGVWGWVLGGALLGYVLNSNSTPLVKLGASRKKVRSEQSLLEKFMLLSISLVVGILLAYPPFLADHKFRIANQLRDGNLLIESTRAFPEDLFRTLSASNIFAQSKMYKQSLDLALHTVDSNKRFYSGWSLVSQVAPPNSKESILANQMMKSLNPNDLNLQK